MKTTPSITLTTLFGALISLQAEIPQPVDAPKPLSPIDALASFRVPPDYAIKLLASEPLIHEPSGVCWDGRGRAFVCELHGYNVEGQYDIEELNKTGKLDMEVRRIQASDAAKQRAKADNYGTVKLLTDTDGDGVMDKAQVWADHLPLCYGVVPANGGVIVACPPDIVFLKDSNGDGRCDVREVLFTGFGVGQPERGVNAPTWGVDNWIYFGRGHGGGTITGPHLKNPVVLGNTDFRIRADGSAIEAITGSTKTVGMAFTEGGDRFVTTTTSPGLFVTPIEPRYFGRNTDAAAPLGDRNAASYDTCFPIAAPHPWRLRREQHGDYFAFYKKISLSDAAASGYFTSVCGPMVYQDSLMPELRGEYFSCEPAQNLVHRARIERQGAALRLKRVPGEEKCEFFASSDAWFHPIFLHPTPDGSIAVTDFYREIIEDYSAIPRHLQQQYGLLNGRDHGRIWVLTKAGHKPEFQVNLASLEPAKLVQELDSNVQWRRQTARRLLVERKALTSTSPFHLSAEPGAALDTLYAFEGCGALTAEHLLAAWHHPSPEVRRQALQIADQEFSGYGRLVEAELFSGTAVGVDEPQVALQVALSLGNSVSPKLVDALATLARKSGDQMWMDSAIASSAAKQEATLLKALVAEPGNASKVIEYLAGVLAGRGDVAELSTTVAALEATDPNVRALHLLKLGLEETKPLAAPELQVAPKPPGAEEVAFTEGRLPDFIEALKGTPNLVDGRALFTAACSACHRSHGIGSSVGPELDAESQRAPEVILRDILFPHESQRPGFETVMAKTQRGEIIVGIAVSDSPTSVTLRLPGGTERTVLRKRASISTVRNVSVMPFGFGQAFQPAQIADIIGFLRSR